MIALGFDGEVDRIFAAITGLSFSSENAKIFKKLS